MATMSATRPSPAAATPEDPAAATPSCSRDLAGFARERSGLVVSREELEAMAWAWVGRVDDPEVDISEDDVEAAYKLHFPTHYYPRECCKRNCRFNPKCYCGLGASRWLTASDSEATDDDDLDPCDLMPDRREVELPAGLKNLGNTCYVNSFLQIWFHNVLFRQALYEWDPGQDLEECENESLLEAEHYEPRGKVASLQALFAMMEFTNRSAVDPNDFIAKLGLDPQVQQDAQEFSKLFMSLLESSLSSQRSATVKSMVQNQFRGEYAYVTTCCKCNKESERPSFFYELDLTLQGHKTLLDCLQDFLKKEKLEGDNQYFCGDCNSKQDATRCVRLLQLPPVLNLQLNRFIFDMQTGRKKKLNSFVQFPEQLDVSEYLRQEPGTTVYCLTGVLMHVGAEANHGHYLAHIQEPQTGQWFKFSDAIVDRIIGKNPKLGSENDPLETVQGKKGKNPKISKGNQASNNAYMLVYTEQATLQKIRQEEDEKAKIRIEIRDRGNIKEGRKNNVNKRKLLFGREKRQRKRRTKRTQEEQSINEEEEEEDAEDAEGGEEAEDSKDDSDKGSGYVYVNGLVYPANFPIYLRAYIEQDRRLMDEEIEEAMIYKREKLSERAILRVKMRQICQGLPYDPEDSSSSDGGGEHDEFEFVPTDWLARFLDNPRSSSVIETINYLCIHGKLELDKINDVKVVDAGVADRLYEEAGYGHGRRLTRESLCEICVKNKCRKMQLDRNLAIDTKVVQDLTRSQVLDSSEPAYWIGKLTLKSWKKLAKTNLGDLIMEEAFNYAEDQEISDALMEGARIGCSESKSSPTVISFSKRQRSNSTMSSASSNGSSAKINLEEVQSKLSKVGTNVSLVRQQTNGGGGATKKESNGIVDVGHADKTVVGGITVIHKCEARNVHVGSEITEDFTKDMMSKAAKEETSAPTLENGTSGGHEDVDPDDVQLNGCASRVKQSKSSPGESVISAPPSIGNGAAVEAVKENGQHSTVDSEIANGKKQPKVACDIPKNEEEVFTPNAAAAMCYDDSQILQFNTEIICRHGELNLKESIRRLIPASAWQTLLKYFPDARAFPRNCAQCAKCEASLSETVLDQERRRDLAQEQRAALADVINERNRPSWAKASMDKVYLIPRSFVNELRMFINKPQLRDPITELGNKQLLCTHNGLLYPLDLDTESDYESIVFMVSEEEWSQIKRFFKIDEEIVVTRNKNGPELLTSSPPVCEECVMMRHDMEEQEKLCYKNVPIFIRRMTGSEKAPPLFDPSDPDFAGGGPSGDVVPSPMVDSSNGATPVKRLKLSNGGSSSDHIRRSNRRQKVRGEREIVVSSSMLLRDLKVKIMEQFKVAPFDQNLTLNGTYLTDSGKTLAELKVLPRSLIYLRADEPSENGHLDVDDSWPMTHPEEGFKGTGLLSGF